MLLNWFCLSFRLLSGMKKSIYLETSIISYLTGRPSRDLVTAARQQLTQEWWDTRRSDFSLYIAQPVLNEAADGDPEAAKKRLSILRKLPMVSVTDEVGKFAGYLVKETPFPENARIDALHIAVASIQKMDYILTWNFKHIANASMRSKLEILAESKNINLPVICTPEELLY